MPDLTSVREKLVTTRRDVLSRQHHLHKLAIHMPVRLDPRDGFLPDVTALIVADRPRLQARLIRNRVLVHIRPPLRHGRFNPKQFQRSEEHTSELQSQFHLVCRLLLEKKKSSSRISARRSTAATGQK